MAPHLSPQVIAAIETAVECNEGNLESAFIHSLAKIYKTSPQAIVWNMKRYNKVKAGCDDRQKTGRRATMDKGTAAVALKEWLAEEPVQKMELLCDKLFDKFGARVSTTWVSRVIRGHKIQYRVSRGPKSPRTQKEGLPNSPKLPKESRPRGEPANKGQYPDFIQIQQYQLPQLDEYPAFRQDLQQAIYVPPDAQHDPRDILGILHHDDRENIPGVLFGILKPQPPPKAPVVTNQYSKASQYQYQPTANPSYPSHGMFSPATSSTPSTPIDPALPAYDPVRSQSNKPPNSSAANDCNWQVLKVVELP